MSEHEKTRYSDEELLEFKKIILDKLEKAKADYDLLRSTITHTSSNDIEDTSPTFKVLEEGAATLSKEESGRLAQRQLKFIQHLEAALVRIENKSYGICRCASKPKASAVSRCYGVSGHTPGPVRSRRTGAGETRWAMPE